MRTLFLVSISLVLSASAAAELLDLSGLHGLARVHRFEVEMEEPEQRLFVLVRLPETYDESEARQYPVVFLLDGGATFAPLAGYTRYLELAEEVPELIVVGLSYGTADWRQGNQRSRDYTAPSPERDHWGGADAFLEGLQMAVLPLVEKRFRADPKRRILFGQSIGGQLALHAATHRPDLFWGLIASNPALHRNLDLFLQPPPEVRPDGRPRLFVSSGTEDDPRFRQPAQAWIGHWTAQEIRPWELETRDLAGHSHFSALPAAYRQGLRWLLEEPE